LADRLVYGTRAAPYEALAILSRRLADSPSPDELPGRVAEATGRAVGAAGVVVQLGRPGEPSSVRSAAWSETSAVPGLTLDGLSAVVLPVRDASQHVGSIAITMPPGRALRTSDRRLLQDVAAQAGVAFRNALLEAELATRVDESEAQSVELAASRRRLLDVEDEAREQLAGAIQGRVVPHLAAVETELSIGPVADPHLSAGRLDALVGEIDQALQELRTVCRGVFPALLDRRGLIAALSAQLDLTHPYTRLDIDDIDDRRLNRAVEAAGYLFCTEVAPIDQRSLIKLRVDEDQLVATITSDTEWASETGPRDRPAGPVTWQHSRDRVAALDGALTVLRDGHGVTVTAAIPLDQQLGFGSVAALPKVTAH
jgi:signal transduction histidine kinase